MYETAPEIQEQRDKTRVNLLKGGKFIGYNTGEFMDMPIQGIPYPQNKGLVLTGEESGF